MDENIKKRTQETAAKLFNGGIKMDPPYFTWKAFDRDLANDLSMFIPVKLMRLILSSSLILNKIELYESINN